MIHLKNKFKYFSFKRKDEIKGRKLGFLFMEVLLIIRDFCDMIFKLKTDDIEK